MKQGETVMVTTAHRGVFYGTFESQANQTVTLRGARNCIYWDQQTHGFLGLAAQGPGSKCKVGPAVPEMEIRDVTSIAVVTPEAAARWEEAPWQS